MSEKEKTQRDRRGQELKAIVRHAAKLGQTQIIEFDVVVAHRTLLVLRDREGNYRPALTTDYDRCGERTRELSMQAAVREAKAHYDEKRFILGCEETYGDIVKNYKRNNSQYWLIEAGAFGSDPRKEHGPFKVNEYEERARELHEKLDEESVLLVATVAPGGELKVSAFCAGFFEQGAAAQGA